MNEWIIEGMEPDDSPLRDPQITTKRITLMLRKVNMLFKIADERIPKEIIPEKLKGFLLNFSVDLKSSWF